MPISKLNLPAYDCQLRRGSRGEMQIYDRLRAKYVCLTPEEWVRQHFVNFLIEHRAYPPVFMANEVGLRLNGCLRRCDTIIYNRAARPAAIVEYKAPEVQITPAVFDQIVRYNMVLRVSHLIVSNGLSHYCCRIQAATAAYQFLKDIPPYETLIEKD